MSAPDRDAAADTDTPAARRRERERRLRAARMLGETVPATTRDESAEGWSERDDARDDELRRDVPPHHGG